jgi:hypothetical protein
MEPLHDGGLNGQMSASPFSAVASSVRPKNETKC